MNFDLSNRKEVLAATLERIDRYYQNTKDFKASPVLDINNIKDFIGRMNLNKSSIPEEAIDHVLDGLENFSVHTPHPKYFGLFNPRSNFAGILADIITAFYNPQLAAWSHAPFAVEIEAKVIKDMASKFGYEEKSSDGVFTTGGAEANLTALLCALNDKYEKYSVEGLLTLNKRPIVYCSQEAHHSIQKAARTVGLGVDSVRTIKTDSDLALDIQDLKRALNELDKERYEPLIIIGTAGTTGTGAIDDLKSLNQLCKSHGIWFHVDAAYGGGAVLSDSLKNNLDHIQHSDSITFDAHKWMSVPMGTSMFLTSHNNILSKTFRITTEYMPKEASDLDVIEPYSHSIQWSRRFNGLKIYLSLLIYGWQEYEKIIDHQTRMGEVLRSKLINDGWVVKNKTPFPIVCFTDSILESDEQFTSIVLDRILSSGKSWLSVYPVNGVPCFRACITNYSTTEHEVSELVNELNMERERYTAIQRV